MSLISLERKRAAIFKKMGVNNFPEKFELTKEHLEIFDAFGALGESLWKYSGAMEGLSSDPKMISIMLYRRLWGHFRGYSLLWRNNLNIEADTILRSAIEVTICLTANAALKEKFFELLQSDAAETLKRTIKIWREIGDDNLVKNGEEILRGIFGHKKIDGGKHRALDWEELATAGGFPHLYAYHKQLSGSFTHVTGVSILRGVVPGDDSAASAAMAWEDVSKTLHVMIMIGAMALGCRAHAEMVDAREALTVIEDLDARLKHLSMNLSNPYRG